MLDHLHGEHHVETLAGVRQRLGRGHAVINREAAGRGVMARRLDIALGRIGADDGGAKPRQRLAQDTAAAADIENAQRCEGVEPPAIARELAARRVLDESEPHRVELVQHPHAAAGGLSIDYRVATAEALADAGERFDAVLAMEVVEHVADLGLFVGRCAEMVKPGGLMIVATINRTLKSFALAIVGAEYVLRWLPRGTHRWEKFVTPVELKIVLKQSGLDAIDEAGVVYNLLADRWQTSKDMDVNYMIAAARPES